MEKSNKENNLEKNQTQPNQEQSKKPTVDKIEEKQPQFQNPLRNQGINLLEINNPNNNEINPKPQLAK